MSKPRKPSLAGKSQALEAPKQQRTTATSAKASGGEEWETF
jgi:hypothetical protein